MSADSVGRWVSAYTPARDVRYDLKWQFQNAKGAAGGKAAARIAPPDTLRFDLRGPFGKSGNAVVVGSSPVWSKPEGGDLKDLLQAAPLFWAALGAPIRPPENATTFGVTSPGRRAWRYAAGVDTFDFVDLTNPRGRHLLAEMRRRGAIVGRTDATYDASGHVASARIDFRAAETRFSFSVEGADSSETFDPAIWAQP